MTAAGHSNIADPEEPPRIRVGVTGLESSHVDALVETLNLGRRYPGARVVALCGTDDERCATLAERGGIDLIVSRPDDLAGLVDAVVVCDRRGSTHREIAEPLLARRLPVLVDKPFAACAQDAQAMVDTARASGAMLTSYSSLRFTREVEELASAVDGHRNGYTVEVRGPADPHSPYDGAYFYLSHHTDIVARLTSGPLDVLNVHREGSGWIVTASAGPGRAVLRFEPQPTPRTFAVGIPELGPMRTIGDAALAVGFTVFLDAVRTGRPPVPLTDLVRPIGLLDAIAGRLAAL